MRGAATGLVALLALGCGSTTSLTDGSAPDSTPGHEGGTPCSSLSAGPSQIIEDGYPVGAVTLPDGRVSLTLTSTAGLSRTRLEPWGGETITVTPSELLAAGPRMMGRVGADEVDVVVTREDWSFDDGGVVVEEGGSTLLRVGDDPSLVEEAVLPGWVQAVGPRREDGVRVVLSRRTEGTDVLWVGPDGVDAQRVGCHYRSSATLVGDRGGVVVAAPASRSLEECAAPSPDDRSLEVVRMDRDGTREVGLVATHPAGPGGGLLATTVVASAPTREGYGLLVQFDTCSYGQAECSDDGARYFPLDAQGRPTGPPIAIEPHITAATPFRGTLVAHGYDEEGEGLFRLDAHGATRIADADLQLGPNHPAQPHDVWLLAAPDDDAVLLGGVTHVNAEPADTYRVQRFDCAP